MNFNFLNDVCVVDFTTRLPGPMSTMVLKSLGAEVLKVENTDISPDPFKDPGYLQHAPHFEDWYDNINTGKIITKASFSKDKVLLQSILSKSNIILVPDIKFFQSLLSEFQLNNKAIIKLSGGKDEWSSLHDLNALALTNSFQVHLQSNGSPPYLPLAGITYAQYLATAALGLLRSVEKDGKTKTETIYLKDVSQLILDSLHSNKSIKNGKYLHNGAFPCYQVYYSKDGFAICLAAVEEKYWNNFVDIFEIDLSEEKRFDPTGKSTELIKNMFAKLRADEISSKSKKAEICLTIARTNK